MMIVMIGVMNKWKTKKNTNEHTHFTSFLEGLLTIILFFCISSYFASHVVMSSW